MPKKLVKRQKAGKPSIKLQRREIFARPLPHPDTFARYEQICKGSAKRILKMAEKQSHHRQVLENKVVSTETRNETIGMIFSFIITLALMALGAYLIMNDKEITGYISFFSPAIFHAGVFVYNKYKSNKDQKENNKAGED